MILSPIILTFPFSSCVIYISCMQPWPWILKSSGHIRVSLPLMRFRKRRKTAYLKLGSQTTTKQAHTINNNHHHQQTTIHHTLKMQTLLKFFFPFLKIYSHFECWNGSLLGNYFFLDNESTGKGSYFHLER